MRASRTLTAIAAVAASVLVVAPTASAYDREAYEYAAGHMIERSDIPKVLGDFDESLGFSAGLGVRTYLCYLPSSTPDAAGTDVQVGRPQLQYSGFYSPSKGPQVFVVVRVLQFGSAGVAIKGFEALKTQSRKCKGAGSTTWTNDDGTETTSSWRVATSVVPQVTVAGVPSIGITQDNLSVSSDGGKPSASDNYTVYTLVNDVILSTSYEGGSTTNMTKDQRKATNQVAFNAVSRWLGVS
ncbi:MAG TPA: hypothetical protein DCQ36_01900 [Actinobacteria bacterium]|jgi:hypothetical protein|nr:hypothetical protein [Actinomycetota bacterium]